MSADHSMLVLEDRGGEPLDRFIGAPMEIGRFLRRAVAISAALSGLHERALTKISSRVTS